MPWRALFAVVGWFNQISIGVPSCCPPWSGRVLVGRQCGLVIRGLAVFWSAVSVVWSSVVWQGSPPSVCRPAAHRGLAVFWSAVSVVWSSVVWPWSGRPLGGVRVQVPCRVFFADDLVFVLAFEPATKAFRAVAGGRLGVCGCRCLAVCFLRMARFCSF